MFGLFKRKKPEPEEVTPDIATFYLSDQARLDATVAKDIPGAKSCEEVKEGEMVTGLRVHLKAGDVALNFMPAHMLGSHLDGMVGYMEESITDPQRLADVISRIRKVKSVVGCVITPGFDDRGKILEGLLTLNNKLNGMFFLGDSLFDADSQPLSGSAWEERGAWPGQ